MPELAEIDEGQQAPPPVLPPGIPLQPQAAPVSAPAPNPIDAAQAAVAAALQFQARRGYQRDLDSGASGPEALAKWAPMMFAPPRNTPETAPGIPRSSSGMALSPLLSSPQMVKSAQPPVEPIASPASFVPPKPTELQMGGVLYRRTPQGDLVEVPGQRQRVVPAPKSNAFDVQRFKDMEAEIKEAKKEFYNPDSPSYQSASQRMRIQNLEKAADAIAARNAPTGSAPSTAKKTVIRRTKDNKRAIFDAETKKFIRYAD